MPLRLILLTLALLLAGCATTPQPQRQQVDWSQERLRLEQLTHWQLSGKLAIITEKEKGSARLNWQQEGDDYRLNLTSVIGTHILELSRQSGRLTLIDRDGNRHQSQDAGDLIYRLTGWELPIDGLPEWIKGLPGEARYTLNPDKSLASVTDGAWQIDYQQYRDQDGYRLPHQLSLQGEGTRLKLLINEWSLK
ncbi:lipoprotein insertase outer membrane protein LolB [Aeromonas schubertii]|uniref:Outer-membrane lipoprotein LolB n=1 Tax=Aeromonas schubertii TaxID=652 RepID=A0A0S2SHD8_9GAMM|nr:lipoprotein insertase outer membrane protein LolB [Aeromonas schubertii]ALP41108.1 outer membrane lipoprotein LolB [Aeromonas schubertii]KUE78758.1 outer membrane lipoprotein LolB [Aeromonas schubertii]MBZ6065661.1 lipoprotein insertase outer membrane protein LolB [Aeromonas schubertii]MBZ6072593.1 lipoprotein insertase outer membrane protein LolB [Aeromonas schubertii]QCG46962.1 outer membrane lipoprotein LolB [Aeromonas schubertii]